MQVKGNTKGGDFCEAREETDAKAEDQARTSGPFTGKLARYPGEAKRRANHITQEH
jgi:hypothetical protein